MFYIYTLEYDPNACVYFAISFWHSLSEEGSNESLIFV
jgi:hypothetical protein